MWKLVSIGLVLLVFIIASVSSVVAVEADEVDIKIGPPSTIMPQASEIMVSSPPEDFDYVIVEGKEAHIKRYIGTGREVVIPSEIEGVPVTVIGENAFERSFVRSVIIPGTVTHIHDYAFYYCTSMTSIVTPDALSYIGEYAFSGCGSLAGITIPGSTTRIGSFAFFSCSSLTSITIPASVDSIGNNAFYYCFKMKDMQFKGDAPPRYYGWDDLNSGIKVYYVEGASGFGPLAELGIETIAVTALDAPANLKAVAGAEEVSLTWDAPSNAGEPISYEIWYGASEDSSTWALFGTVNGLAVTVTSLGDVTTYHFGVRATNVAGPSEFSSTFITVPDAPSITAVASDRQVELRWDAPYDGGAAILEYIIYRDGAKIGETTETSFLVFGLTNGQACTFQVAAENIAGIGEKSEAVSATPRTVPNTPTDVVATLSDDHSSITLGWKAPEVDGGSEIIGYEVWFRKSGGHWIVLTDVNALTVTIDGLEHSTTYLFSVKAINIAGASDLSSILVTTLATPEAPVVSAVAGDGQVTLSWNIPNDGGSVILEYIVCQDGAELVRITESEYFITGLNNGVEYRFQVAARNAIGIGPNSADVSVIPLPELVPVYGNVVDANGNGLAGVTVSLESGLSVTTGDDGNFSIMASQGKYLLTISGGHIVTTARTVDVNGMQLDVGAVTVNYASSGEFGDFEYATAGGKIAVTRYVGPGGDIIIPSTINAMPVTSINNWAFRDCVSITSIAIPDSVTSIGNYAFYQCSSLASVHIGIAVDHIGGGAFYGCTSLASVTIPGAVTCIGDYAFSQCDSLTSIAIPDSVTDIGLFAFSQCSSMTSIEVGDANANYASFDGALYNKDMTTLIACPAGKIGAFVIPDGITITDDWAFYGCSKLTSVIIPDGVTSIGWNAFYRCSSLISMMIPGSVEDIGDYAFSSCDRLTSVAIGNGVITIGAEAFNGCRSLTSMVIPDSVTSIGRSAFGGCYSLTGVLLGSGVTSIDETAFSGCSNLTSITIPSSVESIGGYAFTSCNNLTSMYFEGDAPGNPMAWRVIKPGLKVYYIDGAEGFDRSRWGETELTALTAPGASVDLDSAARKGEVALEWTAPSDDGGSAVTGYEVWYGTSADSSAWVLFSTVDALSATVTGLEPGTTYYFGVKAVNFAGASKPSPTSVTTPNTITFDANDGIGITPEAITADHDSVVDLPGAGGLVKSGHTFGGWSLTVGGEAVDDQFTLTSDVTLYAVWKINKAVPSAVLGLVFNGIEQIGVPDGVGYALSGHKATNAGEYKAMATLVDGYIWDDGTTESKEIIWTMAAKEVIVTPDGQTKVFGDEDPTLTYELSETAEVEGALSRAAGEDVGTYAITIGTLYAKNDNYHLKMIDTVRFEIMVAYPGAPNITNVEPSDGQIMFSWNVPYGGGADIEIYIIYQDGEEIVRTTGTTYAVTGLVNGQAYTFQVAAKNAAGVGNKSESVSATPLPAMAPIHGKVVDGDGNGIASVKVTLDNDASVTTDEDGSFSIMASQGVHTLTFSGDRMEATTQNVTVSGTEIEVGVITSSVLDVSGDNTTLLAVAIGVMTAVIVAAFVFVRMKK